MCDFDKADLEIKERMHKERSTRAQLAREHNAYIRQIEISHTPPKQKGYSMERKYLKGFYVNKKESKYGTFLKCSIKYDDFINNLVPNDKGYVNFCIFETKEGKPYAVIDDYTPQSDNEIKNFEDETPF